MSALTTGSLFSGYGGLDLAVEQVTGARTAWVSDIDKGACKILAHRYPLAPNLGDLTKVDWSAVEPVDIITGGFPCQDLSTAGKRAGLAGARSGLWSEMCKAINILQPRLVVAENVRGLLSAKTADSEEVVSYGPKGGRRVGHTNRALGRVLSDLADIGYDASWYGLRAADIGACHGRFRIFLVAYPRGEHGLEWGQSAPSEAPSGWSLGELAGRGGTPPGLSLLPTPTTTQRGTDANLDTREGARANLHNSVALLPTPAVNDMGAGKTVDAWDAWTDRMKTEHANGNGHGASLSIEALRLLPTPRAGDGEKGGPNQRGSSGDRMMPSAVHDNFGQYEDAVRRWESLTHAAPNPTEPTGKNGARRLSPRFVEWMMGLDDGWVTDVPDLSRNDQLKACGNGVVPQQAAAALRLLLPTISA